MKRKSDWKLVLVPAAAKTICVYVSECAEKTEKETESKLLVCLIALAGDLFLIDVFSHFSNWLQLETLKEDDSKGRKSANLVSASKKNLSLA